jgi:hypothetical protein
VIEFDLNQRQFQEDLLALEKEELLAFFKTLRKLRQLSWQQLYHDRGLRWEAVKSVKAEGLYTMRVTKKCRVVVKREGNILRFISLHPDHDSAYE